MTIEKLNKAMNEVSGQNKDGVKVQGGKKYTNVSTRVEMLRRNFGFDVGRQPINSAGHNHAASSRHAQ